MERGYGEVLLNGCVIKSNNQIGRLDTLVDLLWGKTWVGIGDGLWCCWVGVSVGMGTGLVEMEVVKDGLCSRIISGKSEMEISSGGLSKWPKASEKVVSEKQKKT